MVAIKELKTKTKDSSLIEDQIENIAGNAEEPDWMRDLRYRAMEEYNEAPLDDPVISDPLEFVTNHRKTPADGINSLDDLPDQTKSLLDKLGISELERKAITGLAIQDDTDMIDSSFRDGWEERGVTMAHMEDALKEYPELRKKFGGLYTPEESKLTAYHTAVWSGGIFLHVEEGAKVEIPLHLFFLIQQEGLAQAPHIIIWAEPNSEIQLVEGCTAPVLPRSSLHLDMTELYIEEGAKVDLTVLQNWPEYVHTRPTQRGTVGKNAELTVTTVGLGPGKSNVTDPQYWVESGGQVEINSITLANEESLIDLGGQIYLDGNNSSGVNNSKGVIMDDSKMITRGTISARAPETRGHISCDALVMDDGAVMETYPGLSSSVDDAELSHEAAIGKIKDDELFYLMSRGLDEETATQLIVQGFVNPVVEDLPDEFLDEVKQIIDLSVQGEL